MSLIPWVTADPNPTIVTKGFNLKGRAVYVKNFDPTELNKEENTNATYDLRVGGVYRPYGKTSTFDINENNPLIIGSKKAVVVYTEEEVQFPEGIFGLIVARETLLQEGVSIITTKVDPGYGPGKLHITVINDGEKPYTLPYKTRFCALCLLQVLEGIRPRGSSVAMPPPKGRKPRWPRFRALLAENAVVLTVLSLILLAISVALGVINFLRSLHGS